MARQKTPQRRAVDLNKIVSAALEMLEYQRRSSGLELTLDLDGRLPHVDADPDLLSQVVINLLLNAGQVVRDQPSPRRIWVSTTSDGTALTLLVADNGPGVPPDIRSRIFEPYFTTKPAGAGTGIGLAISKSIVEAHGGRIGLKDREGGGAVFEVTFAVQQTVENTPKHDAPTVGARQKILIVDDEPDIALALAEVLEELGHQPTVENDSGKALTRIGKTNYDVIFTDLHMPGLNGLDLRQRISTIDNDLARRTIIVTGDTILGPDTIADRIGHSDVIVLEKPFTPADVANAVLQAAAPARPAERS